MLTKAMSFFAGMAGMWLGVPFLFFSLLSSPGFLESILGIAFSLMLIIASLECLKQAA